jgi:hypothetical protein
MTTFGIAPKGDSSNISQSDYSTLGSRNKNRR